MNKTYKEQSEEDYRPVKTFKRTVIKRIILLLNDFLGLIRSNSSYLN